MYGVNHISSNRTFMELKFPTIAKQTAWDGF